MSQDFYYHSFIYDVRRSDV